MCPSSSVLACASLSEMQGLGCDPSSTVVLLSIMSLTQREIEAEFDVMTGCDRRQRTMVLAETDNLDEALSALRRGANGYISTSAGLEVFIHALRFVAVGGTYVPAQCVLLARSAEAPVAAQASPGSLTGRECAVIQAIRQGKPNKVIAYELNMCESTVKVHVRHIMKKLRAKNRTDVAIKAADLAPTPSIGANGALSSLGFAKRASMI
jgi:DNA-binding NarL/FixJ family response regulator